LTKQSTKRIYDVINHIIVLLVLDFNKCVKIVKQCTSSVCVIDWRFAKVVLYISGFANCHFYTHQRNFTKFSLLMYTTLTSNRGKFRVEI